MKKQNIAFLLVLTFGATSIALAQDQDCACNGNWVKTVDVGPYSTPYGPYLIESFQTEACESYSIVEHTHIVHVDDHCNESGGSCSTLGWRSELQTLYSNDHDITITIPSYTIPSGYEAREEKNYSIVKIAQTFECQVEGNPQKALTRYKWTQANTTITVRLNKLRDCPEAEPPGGSGG